MRRIIADAELDVTQKASGGLHKLHFERKFNIQE